jgi:hypothetical protein
MVDGDFFQWVRSSKAEEVLAPVWERTLDQMLTYDLARLNQDVLKGVYQELVDPKDRHDLGEYYTPEWLAERVVTELLPASGFVSVLDPSCSSGSFLRATIAYLLAANKEGGEVKRLRAILDNVAGIDIHPVLEVRRMVTSKQTGVTRCEVGYSFGSYRAETPRMNRPWTSAIQPFLKVN